MNSVSSAVTDFVLSKSPRCPVRPLKEDEYRNADNLICCKKCNTPREVYIELDGKTFLKYALCICQAKVLKDAADAKKAQREQDRLNRIRNIALPDPRFREYTFEADLGFNPHHATIARNYVKHFEEFKKKSQGLLFWGDVGTGKTYLAGCIVNALVDKGYAPLQTNFSRLLNTLSGYHTEDKNAFIDNLNAYDLLVIDDLGIERNTDFTMEMCFHIIDSRYRSGLPMIITTNITLHEMNIETNKARKRIFDRILERCHPVCVNDKNVRKLLIEAEKQKNLDLLLSDPSEKKADTHSSTEEAPSTDGKPLPTDGKPLPTDGKPLPTVPPQKLSHSL